MSTDPNNNLNLIKDPTSEEPVLGEVVQVKDALVEDQEITEDNDNKTPLEYIKES